MADTTLDIIECTSLRDCPLARVNTLPDVQRPRHDIPLDINDEQFRADVIWKAEGITPIFKRPEKLIELHILEKPDKLVRLDGQCALKRLCFVCPTVFSRHSHRRGGSVGQVTVDSKICFRISGPSLRRSIKGVYSGFLRDPCSPHFELPKKDFPGKRKAERFYNCISKIFVFFHLYKEENPEPFIQKLGRMIVRGMIDEGCCESNTATTFSSALNVILHGIPRNALESRILTFETSVRSQLWKTRRLLYKDDFDDQRNIRKAIARMQETDYPTNEQRLVAEVAIGLFQKAAREFVSSNEEKLRRLHDTHPLHRASATLFFTRKQGGGAAELALITGMHRLHQGYSSALCDLWGSPSDDIDLEELWDWTTQHAAHRQEMLNACEWFLDELKIRKIPFPYLCIYPEREPKGRTFMILPYALQQPCAQAATVLSEFFRTFSDTKEVFEGFRNSALLRRMQCDADDERTDTIMSLDSAVATDSLHHEWCQKIYEPFYTVFSDLTIKAIKTVFSPTLVYAAKGRPKPVLDLISYETLIGQGISLIIDTVEEIEDPRKGPSSFPLSFFPQRVPKFLRTYSMRREIVEALHKHNRIILCSPTGSGKTVLAASLFNSIIQFPSIAALEIFSSSLKDLGITHLTYYSKSKVASRQDPKFGSCTILCTSFFVESLHKEFRDLLVVLDEAETKQERFLYNLYWTKRDSVTTLIMSATPEELLGEENTPRLQLAGGTNFPIEELRCSERDMIAMVTSPGYPQSLICTYSEPKCIKLANDIRSTGRKVLLLTSEGRAREYEEELKTAQVIISTNVIRSSVTIPNLKEVFDYGLYYEKVDLPLVGIETLQLFSAGDAMRKQLKGRVGRVAPGRYWAITGLKMEEEPYSPKLLCRCPLLASQIEQVSMRAYARELNQASLIVERFSQLATGYYGKFNPYEPHWVSIAKSLYRESKKSLEKAVEVLGFELLGIAGRINQFKADDELGAVVRGFENYKDKNYALEVRLLLQHFQTHGKIFATELFQLGNFMSAVCLTRPEEISNGFDDVFTTQVERKFALASLWRQVAKYERGALIGKYRNFSVSPPDCILGTFKDLQEGNHCVLLGLNMQRGHISARAMILLEEELVDSFEQHVVDNYHVVRNDAYDFSVLTYRVLQTEKGNQKRSARLITDKYPTHHVFRPEQLDHIWAVLSTSLSGQRPDEEVQDGTFSFSAQLTTKGSPMSSTASFSVLNGLGLASDMYARHVTGEHLTSASVYGDDSLVVGSRKACDMVRLARESFGLRTKEEATGYVTLKGEHSNRDTALALFTERVIDPRDFSIVYSMKPAGLVRLYHAYHHDHMLLADTTYLPDMDHHAQEVERNMPSLWKKIITPPLRTVPLFAVRETAPRMIVRRAMTARIGPDDRVAEGPDVKRLFDLLESVVLLKYPSTRGQPDRVVGLGERFRSTPVVSLRDAKRFAENLQGNRCYFALKGPPLRFRTGDFAIRVARAELDLREPNHTYFSDRAIMSAIKWGEKATSTTRETTDIRDWFREEEEGDLVTPPIEFYDLPF